MSKYIDADLLRKDIDNWKEAMADAVGEYSDGVRFALEHFTFVLDSLQQERPSLPSNLDKAANIQAALEQPYKWEEEQDGSFGVTPLFVMSNIRSAFKAGAEWQANQLLKGSPLPEDTVLFQKGVAEGRRLEREDNNKALAEMYGYEGGTESPLVKITFTIPKEQVKNLMPIKQGDVFGIENLTNKEGRR